MCVSAAAGGLINSCTVGGVPFEDTPPNTAFHICVSMS